MSSNAEEIAKAKAKISKLLNMTVENGCSEDEQETAMMMAASIATRLGIDLEAQRQTEATPAQRKAIKKSFNQEFKIHQVLAFQAAAKLYGCEVYTYAHGKGGLFFVGREENCELAEQTAFWLMRQVELLYKENLPRGLTQSVRAQYRKTFKAACAYRVKERADQLMFEMRSNDAKAQEATGKNALVVQGYFEQLKRENAAFWEPTEEEKARQEQRRLEHQKWRDEHPEEARELDAAIAKANRRASKRKGPRARTLPTGVGSSAGFAAGDRVQLRREIK